MSEFSEFPKMARLSRECIITEKIDGTNAQIYIVEQDGFTMPGSICESGGLAMFAGSRTRWITPESDNFGFASWAKEHADELFGLGTGRHFGEWWGCGIQRGYGLTEKRFSLFNTMRWCLHDAEPATIPSADPRLVKMQERLPECVGLVPQLWRGEFNTMAADAWIQYLAKHGSFAAPGFMRPEGIVCFHIAAGVGFKKTIEKDDQPKGKT